MIRTDTVEALCATCHSSGGGRAEKPSTARPDSGPGRLAIARASHRDLDSVHAMGLLQAHLNGGRFSGSSRSAARGAALGFAAIDGESASCLSCHDGTIAKDVGGHAETGEQARSSKSSKIMAMEGPASHPIGVPYRSTTGGRGSGPAIELRSAASLDPRIRLFNQQVGCGSCHSIYSDESKYLVFRNDRSVLCLSCHRM
ncbi:MAG: hypothetical protein JNL80_13105 [Phycisphaerae bacterium]|nr:hypothetical protein [Phycisphaerae bacterium]